VPKGYLRFVVGVVRRVSGHPGRTLLLAALVTLAAAVYAQQSVRINSDDSTLISQDEPFRQDYKAFIDAFPEFDETTVVVITSESIDRAEDAVDAMRDALRARPDLIETVYAPSADDFFEDHGLLYLDLPDLEDVIERLAEAQPALTALSEDPSLRGLFDQLDRSLEELEDEGELPTGFSRMARRISEVTDSLLAGAPRRISWADEFLEEEGTVYRLVILQGRKDFSESISTEHLISEIRETARKLGLVPENGVTVRLTGMVPLAHDEQESLQDGLAFAGALSLGLLAVILGYGVRSLRISVATLVTLLCSITWTTAYAMLTVGEFNIISAAFAVLMIGLGVDFAIHIGLRYEEECRGGMSVREALVRSSRETGVSVSLCALTSAIGFLSFVPTPYPGLGALGIIAGGGMFLSLVSSFTVFPAMLATMRAPSTQERFGFDRFGRVYSSVERHARAWVVVAGVLAVASIALSLRMQFDFSTLSMRDPHSESMVTLKELQAEEIVTDYSATILVPDRARAEALAVDLEALDLVAEARAPSWYVPARQEDKLYMLEDAAFFLEPVLNPEPPLPPPDAAERTSAFDTLHARITALPDPGIDDALWRSIRDLRGSLDRLAAEADTAGRLAELEALVVSDLEERIDWLRRAITVDAVSFEDLPEDTRRRIVAPDGTTRVVALPVEDLTDVDALRRFVVAVDALAPHATGRPAVEVGIGRVVVETFEIAIALALVCVGIVLLLTLGSVADAAMTLLPITLAAFMTTAAGVLIGMPFNMTNVVVIPLILGLGIDSGIHVFIRYRHAGSMTGMMESSTPRAVLLSAVTTLAAFGSLAVSGHLGMRSLGVLLSIAVIALLFCTLVVLPALIALRGARSRR
jgi:hopanoid biosynthesis associated RND transporter like protein HpnN